jgi:hypothetical protein
MAWNQKENAKAQGVQMTAKSKLHLFQNKWLNECYKCNKVIEIGEYVYWHHETKKVKHQDQSKCFYKPVNTVDLSTVAFPLLERAMQNGSPKRWQLESMGIPYPPPQGWKKAVKKEYFKRLEMQQMGVDQNG